MTDRQVRLPPLALTAAIAWFCLALPAGAQLVLPDAAPLPSARPAPSDAAETVFPASPPPGAPESAAGSAASPPEDMTAAPAPAIPVPTPAPPRPSVDAPPAPPSPAQRSIAASPMPPAEAACRASLRRLEVEFEEAAPMREPEGCGIDHPIRVTALSADIALEPEAVLNCAMAEAAARFTRDVIAPAATAGFGRRLETVRHASAYVCRPRNGGRKLSEHAFGNALDLAGFELSGGRTVEVRSTSDPAEQTFLTRLRKAACGPFKTVLGPGSDADHADHFHFDLQPRRSGSAWCE